MPENILSWNLLTIPSNKILGHPSLYYIYNMQNQVPALFPLYLTGGDRRFKYSPVKQSSPRNQIKKTD